MLISSLKATSCDLKGISLAPPNIDDFYKNNIGPMTYAPPNTICYDAVRVIN
jgi:hypothetical protein